MNDFRNDLAHGNIMHNEEGKFHIIRFNGDDRFGGSAEPISAGTVSPYVQKAMELAVKFQALADAVAAENSAASAAKVHRPSDEFVVNSRSIARS